MKTVGIIAEYNPFHLGHQFQLSYCRNQLKADYIVVVMSGDYVQRGAPALLSKELRADMALRCGADLVLELPVSYACASAEFFARGGVELLDGIGVTDLLCFGSEAGYMEPFYQTAEILCEEPSAYRQHLKELLKTGMNFPSARSQALIHYQKAANPLFDEEGFSAFLNSPNNILGIEYCKALRSLKSSITPVTLRREGAQYHSQCLTDTPMPSASAIRAFFTRHIREDASSSKEEETHDFSQLASALPEPAFSLFQDALCRQAFVTEEDLDLLLHYLLLSSTEEDLCRHMDFSPELARRIKNRLNEYQGFLSFTDLLKTRELTRSRIQRALLHLLLHIEETPKKVSYARVLGFQKSAASLLKGIKEKGRLPLLTKLANAPKLLDADGLATLSQDIFASHLYESILSQKEKRPFVHEYQKPVLIRD